MRNVHRDEILGLAAYEGIREQFRNRVIEEKSQRRVSVGDKASALFENHDTVLLQIQEMLRTERITREAAIQHEIETYNRLIPGNDELSATVMIGIIDTAERDEFLVEAQGFERHVALVIDGEKNPAVWEASRELEDRTSAVHYLRFPLTAKSAAHLREKKSSANVELVVDHPVYSVRAVVPPTTLASISEDLFE